MILFVLQVLLLLYFFGCIVTYKIGNRILVEGVGIHSPEFIMFLLYGTGIFIHIVNKSIGRGYIFIVLGIWLLIQFSCHWYYTIFGVSDKKLKGYNECFKNTIRLFPMSETRLIPDLYHIMLHILILINIIFICFS